MVACLCVKSRYRELGLGRGRKWGKGGGECEYSSPQKYEKDFLNIFQ